MASYIEMAAALEHRLRTADGRTLKSFWDRELAQAARLVKRWQAAIEDAAAQLENVAPFRWTVRRIIGLRPPIALRILQAFDKSAASKLITPLIDEAIEILESSDAKRVFLSRQFWHQVFTRSPACELHPALLDAKWKLLWHDIFPLELVDRDNGIEFIIVNSNVPEIGLFGSAVGRLTEQQNARLIARVGASKQPVITILMHHPICRWRDDPPGRFRININRWAFLAHDTAESESLPGLLRAAAPPTCRQIVICGGHVHDIARAGSLQLDSSTSEPGRADRLLILENPALPNVTRSVFKAMHPNSDDLLICERADDATWVPARVRWSDLVEPLETPDKPAQEYATASGNDYVQHEATYRLFLKIIRSSVAAIIVILILLAFLLV